jgi:DNA-binding transcriptional LysR family regulator
MLDVRRLRLLHHLAAYGTVTATAEALRLTGPAVSQQLAVLEREAGLPLLEKHGRTLRLTAAGRLLVAHAEIILGDLAAAEAELAALRGGAQGTVRVAAFPSAARTLMADVWAELQRHPERPLVLQLIEHEPDEAVRALTRREVDLALAHAYTLLPRELPAGCERHPLLDDPVLLALHPATAEERGLTPGATADLAAFAGMPWLVPGSETSCHEMIGRACGAAGFVPVPVAQAGDFSVLTALVAAGAGVALVPRMALPEALPEISLHPLSRPVTRSVFAVTRAGTGRRPEIRHLLDLLERAVSNGRAPLC